MKTKHPVLITMFTVITGDGDVTPPFIFLHSFSFNMEVYIKCLEKVLLISIERVADEDSTSDNGTLRQATQAKEPIVGFDIISATILPRQLSTHFP